MTQQPTKKQESNDQSSDTDDDLDLKDTIKTKFRMPSDGLFDKNAIRICLKWNCSNIKYLNETYDLDATVVMIDELGKI